MTDNKQDDLTTNPFVGLSDAVEVAPEADPNERPVYQEPVAVEGQASVGTNEDGVELSGDQPQAEESVPVGTTKEVLDWVGDDRDRAQSALDAEEAKGEDGRKGLKTELSKKLEQD